VRVYYARNPRQARTSPGVGRHAAPAMAGYSVSDHWLTWLHRKSCRAARPGNLRRADKAAVHRAVAYFAPGAACAAFEVKAQDRSVVGSSSI